MSSVTAAYMAVLLGFAVPASTLAESSDLRGLRIIEDAVTVNGGYGTLSAVGAITIEDAGGRHLDREFRLYLREGPRGTNTSLMEFRKPNDVAGTKLLTQVLPAMNDRIWLFLPTMNKIRRIVGSNRRNSFLGSEFSYEDLTSSAVDDYEYGWLESTECPTAGKQCEVVARYPRLRGQSAYSKSVMWIETERRLTHKVDHYAPNGQRIKTFVVKRFVQINDKYWRIDDSVMVNNITGRRSRMKWKNYIMEVDIPQKYFDPRRLKYQ